MTIKDSMIIIGYFKNLEKYRHRTVPYNSDEIIEALDMALLLLEDDLGVGKVYKLKAKRLKLKEEISKLFTKGGDKCGNT